MLAFVSKFGSRRNQTLIFPLRFNPKTTFPPQNPFLIRPISSKSHLSNPGNANLVSQVLRDYGFTDSNITTVVGRMPRLLSFHPDRNLRPKMEFLKKNVGLSGTSLVRLVVLYPWFFTGSLKKAMVPALEILMRFLNSKEDVLSALNRAQELLELRKTKFLSTNMEFLRSQGVPDSNARKLLINQPKALIASPKQFVKAAEYLKSSGMNVTSLMFLYALKVKVTMSAGLWEKKVAIFKEFGWSDSEMQLVFKKWPCVLAFSTVNIHEKLNFAVGKLKMSSQSLYAYPILLSSSLEKRLIPRCVVLELLISNGIVDKEMNIPSVLSRNAARFEKEYVRKYEKELPAVLDAYDGKIQFVGFDNVKRMMSRNICR